MDRKTLRKIENVLIMVLAWRLQGSRQILLIETYIYRKYNENIFSLSTESFRYEIIVELFLFSIKLNFSHWVSIKITFLFPYSNNSIYLVFIFGCVYFKLQIKALLNRAQTKRISFFGVEHLRMVQVHALTTRI